MGKVLAGAKRDAHSCAPEHRTLRFGKFSDLPFLLGLLYCVFLWEVWFIIFEQFRVARAVASGALRGIGGIASFWLFCHTCGLGP